MGRPYESELAEFDDTYAWSMTASVEELAASISDAIHMPLIVVGSGGSLTSASVACALHTQFTGMLSRVMTPYELAMSPLTLKNCGVLLCTAGGSNPDVLACFEGLVRREPAALAAICTRRGTPLAMAASAYDWASCHEFATPVRKDGFLATNSLLATAVLLVRAYERVFSLVPSLPTTLAELLGTDLERHAFLATLEDTFEPLCARQTLTVLHGLLTQPAAADIESRFTEAALSNVQLADYRNFAHGRHHWLARHANETALLILSGPDDETAATRTAALLPKSVPLLHLRFSHGLSGMIAAVLHSIYLGWIAGKSKNVDPGRPKVPQFGRKLYHLKSIPKSSINGVAVPAFEANAIERKANLSIPTLYCRNQLDEWRDHFQVFSKRLTKTTFNGIIFDYDGTLCGTSERLNGLREDVIAALRSLLNAGILVGIATGRGKSVSQELRLHIRQSKLQKLIMIGYHNAGEIGLLNDETVPPMSSRLHDSLVPIEAALASHSYVHKHARVEAKGQQITLETTASSIVHDLWHRVSEIARHHADIGVQLVQSTHSIDVLAPGVTKRSLLTAMAQRLSKDNHEPHILCIGDRGRWPGNDFDLLAHPYSLSVDQTSNDPTTCWNLAPQSHRYVDACLHYLQSLELNNGTFRIRKLGRKSR